LGRFASHEASTTSVTLLNLHTRKTGGRTLLAPFLCKRRKYWKEALFPSRSGTINLDQSRFVGNLETVKLPVHVRPARSFLNAPCFIDLIEPRVTIRL
jgi:hypothetical protein